MFDLEKRYANTLKDAKKFLENKNAKAGSRSKISKERIEFLVNTNGECPLCGVRFEGANHNTEHVYPIVLGGKNLIQNKIQICVLCNGARNQVMQAIFGHPPYRNNYPRNWTDVKRFLIWCEISIDDPHLAQTLTPSLQQKFMEIRTGGEKFPLSPKRAFGRASTWKVGDEPNYEFTKSSNDKKLISKSMKSKPSRSLGIRIFDRIFRYNESKENKTSKQTEIVDSINDIEQSQLKKGEKRKARKQTYPTITNLNSAKTGLRLPNNPQDFASLILWFVENCNNFSSMKQRKDAIKKIGLVPTSRAAGSFIAINSVVCEEDEYDVEKIESSLLTDLPLLIDSMEMRFSQYDLIYGSDEIESNANLEQYFEAVKNSILTTNGI